MKKGIVMTLVLALVLAVATCVSAATVEGSATVSAQENVEVGGKVTVTVTLNPAVKSGEFFIDYNENVLKLAGQPAGLEGLSVIDSEGSKEGHMGYGFWGTGSTTSTLTYTFDVIGAEGTSSDITVTGVAGQFADAENNNVNFTANKVTVTVGAKADEPVQDPEDNQPIQPSTTEPEPTKPAEENTGDNGTTGKKPTSYPQTGINVAFVAGTVVLALAAGYVVTKRS